MGPYLAEVFRVVSARNHAEPIFLQAVEEVLDSLEPVLACHPEIEESNLIERMCEPQRQIIFRVVWRDDEGQARMNRGFRVGFNNSLGPYKGGLRFHPTVSLGVIKFLGFEQVFKNSLTGLMIGGGKGGADFDPKGKSDHEVEAFCQAFMTELYHHIGDRTDVPAGDIGVSGREIGYLFGQYKRLTQRYELGVLTGKDVDWGGSLGRKEATGFGAVYFAREMLTTRGESLEGKRCVVSGSGNVALYAIKKLHELGAKVVACSDSSGSVFAPDGLDFDILRQVKEIERGRIGEYAVRHNGVDFRSGQSVWDIPCDCAFPCATQNELSATDARTLLDNGCKLVSEGANMPCVPDAVTTFIESGALFGPGKAANAGGVAVSALEMQQNAGLEHWTFEDVDQRLQQIMKEIHGTCCHFAKKYSRPDHYVDGANIGGFVRVAEAMMEHGLV